MIEAMPACPLCGGWASSYEWTTYGSCRACWGEGEPDNAPAITSDDVLDVYEYFATHHVPMGFMG